MTWLLEDSWSKKYFTDLPQYHHDINDIWFRAMLELLTPDGVLVVPTLQKFFNKQGEEVDNGDD